MYNVFKVFCVLSLLFTTVSYAGVNTLSLVDSYRTGSDKVCVYANSQRTETWVKEGAGSCPSYMTFGDDDDEE